ncbi:hypothetical protein [Tenacibaculum maritimum]|uniref:hypothetical protein n=1 Tax=Tenacibaculum maritimum TaxID=107401 RepID=UPI00041FCB42|nr:hypothetical protein [Tenacibaculum maritimum]
MFHKEGFKSIAFVAIITVICIIAIDKFILTRGYRIITQLLFLIPLLATLFFFRNSKKKIYTNNENAIAPINGTVSSIIKNKTLHKLQITITPSLFTTRTIHAPITGKITYVSNGIHINNSSFNAIILVFPSGKNKEKTMDTSALKAEVLQGEPIHFLPFSSKVQLLVPLNSNLIVNLGDQVKSGQHIFSTL